MNEIDRLLKEALSPVENPSETLNEKIRYQMKESGEMKFKKKNYLIAAAVALCLLVIPASVYAASKYLLPKEVAKELEDKKLGDAFGKDGTEVLATVTEGPYNITYLGHVTGESISERTGSAWELQPERTYVAIAIEKADGSKMKDVDSSSIFVSPLIQGLKPWQYNIASMNGSYMEKVIDGVLYRIIESDNVEIFADKELYLAVSDTVFYSNEAFQYDEKTGQISVNDAYKGINILFKLEVDPSKADPEKANAYLKQLEEEWNSDSNSAESNQENNQPKKASNEKNPELKEQIVKDNLDGTKVSIKDVELPTWWADESKVESVLYYNIDVEAENIESLTYVLNKGEFCKYPPHDPDAREFYGDEYSLSYEEQKDRDFQYSIIFRGIFSDYGYDDDINKLGNEDFESRDKLFRDILIQEIESTNMRLTIKLKDGSTIEKTLKFDVLDGNTGHIKVAISVE